MRSASPPWAASLPQYHGNPSKFPGHYRGNYGAHLIGVGRIRRDGQIQKTRCKLIRHADNCSLSLNGLAINEVRHVIPHVSIFLVQQLHTSPAGLRVLLRGKRNRVRVWRLPSPPWRFCSGPRFEPPNPTPPAGQAPRKSQLQHQLRLIRRALLAASTNAPTLAGISSSEPSSHTDGLRQPCLPDNRRQRSWSPDPSRYRRTPKSHRCPASSTNQSAAASSRVGKSAAVSVPPQHWATQSRRLSLPRAFVDMLNTTYRTSSP